MKFEMAEGVKVFGVDRVIRDGTMLRRPTIEQMASRDEEMTIVRLEKSACADMINALPVIVEDRDGDLERELLNGPHNLWADHGSPLWV